MAITYRSDKGSPLTSDEVDENFSTLAEMTTGLVSDTAYEAGWNGVIDVAPSKNAVRDKFEAMDALVVHLAGTETVTGAKTFSLDIIPANTKGLAWASGSYLKDSTGSITLHSADQATVEATDLLTLTGTTTDLASNAAMTITAGSSLAISYGTTITIGGNDLTAELGYLNGVTSGIQAQIDGKVTSGGALGTPSSGVLTNCTGTAAGLTAGTVTTNANMTGDVTSVGNATTIIDTYKTYTTKISLSSAEILALNSSPKQLLPAPGSGKTYELLGVLCNMNFISAAYAANTTLQVLYSGAALVVATNSNIINATVDKIGKMALSAISAAGSTQYLENTALNLNVGGGNPTTGDGTLDIYLTYKIITL
jgi:hypothetical protein